MCLGPPHRQEVARLSQVAAEEDFFSAALSDSLPSAVGYVIEAAALRGLSATWAAIGQLSIPVIAAFGGVFFLSQQFTVR